ncbi:MAG: YDG domain-containing protein [Clostridiales bacterium]|jgi:hypothetical protein|nr:YDG domain-containing protein [Clostridiales bacterium]
MSVKQLKSTLFIALLVLFTFVCIACGSSESDGWLSDENDGNSHLALLSQSPLLVNDVQDVYYLSDQSFVISVTGGSTNKPVNMEIVGSPNVANVEQNGKVSLISTGIFVIRATKLGDSRYKDVTVLSTPIIVKQNNDTDENTDGNGNETEQLQEQDELVISGYESNLIYGCDDFLVKVEGGSVKDKPEIVISNGSEVAEIDSGKVRVLGVGNFTISAYLHGNEHYNPVSATVEIEVAKKSLTFDGISVKDKIYDGTDSLDYEGGQLNGVLNSDIDEVGFTVHSVKAAVVDVGQDIPVNIEVEINGNRSKQYDIEQIVAPLINILPVQIDTPKLTQKKGTRIFEWQSVDWAVGYEVSVNDSELFELNADTTTWTLQTQQSGDYTVTLRAVGADKNFLNSAWSKTLTTTLLELDMPEIKFDKRLQKVSAVYDSEKSIIEWSFDGIFFSTDELDKLTKDTMVYARAIPIESDSLYLPSNFSVQKIVFLQSVQNIRFELTPNGIIVEWDSVSNSISYTVYFGKTEQVVTENKVRVVDLFEFNFSIVANGDDFSVDSDMSELAIKNDKPIGMGTINEPYQIYNIHDLSFIRYESYAHFKLFDNLTLPDSFLSLGHNGAFSGHFDGQNFTIFNVKAIQGLFGALQSSFVTNLHLDVDIQSPLQTDGVGGLAMFADNSHIENVEVSGKILVPHAKNVGGLVGSAQNSKIFKSANLASVRALDTVGGLVGDAQESTLAFVYNSANLTADSVLGGLVGQSSQSLVLSSYNSGNLTIAKLDMSGGIVGNAKLGTSVIANINIGKLFFKNGEEQTKFCAIVGSAGSAKEISHNIYLYQQYVEMGNYWEIYNWHKQELNYLDDIHILNEKIEKVLNQIGVMIELPDSQYFLKDGNLFWQV